MCLVAICRSAGRQQIADLVLLVRLVEKWSRMVCLIGMDLAYYSILLRLYGGAFSLTDRWTCCAAIVKIIGVILVDMPSHVTLRVPDREHLLVVQVAVYYINLAILIASVRLVISSEGFEHPSMARRNLMVLEKLMKNAASSAAWEYIVWPVIGHAWRPITGQATRTRATGGVPAAWELIVWPVIGYAWRTITGQATDGALAT